MMFPDASNESYFKMFITTDNIREKFRYFSAIVIKGYFVEMYDW